jgi:hypothetical protein
MWNAIDGMERFDRRRRWWSGHEDQFAKALGSYHRIGPPASRPDAPAG